jgi:hypothetical protein
MIRCFYHKAETVNFLTPTVHVHSFRKLKYSFRLHADKRITYMNHKFSFICQPFSKYVLAQRTQEKVPSKLRPVFPMLSHKSSSPHNSVRVTDPLRCPYATPEARKTCSTFRTEDGGTKSSFEMFKPIHQTPLHDKLKECTFRCPFAILLHGTE